MKNKKHNMLSLDYGWERSEDHITLAECIEDKNSNRDVSAYDEVCKCANQILTGRQLECFNLYYVDGLTMDEVGKRIGTTKQNVSLHINKGTKQIKKWMSKQD